MEITTIDVSYTIGGATLSLSNSEASNDSYTKVMTQTRQSQRFHSVLIS